MMPNHFPFWSPGQVPPGLMHEPRQDYGEWRPPTNAVPPSKRPAAGEDDDDIQFISEKPVKRHRASEKQPAISTTQQSIVPFAADTTVPNPSPTTTQLPGNGPKDTDRRLSTGMVGLPSDMHAMELACAVRGVSMPVLENFVFDQPFRQPRPPSSPELSPKQLPSTVTPAMLRASGPGEVSNSLTVCSSSGHTSYHAKKPAMAPEATETTLHTNKRPTPVAPINSNSHAALISSDYSTNPPGDNMRPSENHHHHNGATLPQKHPCRTCSRLRHQAQLSRVQGLPMVTTAIPHQFIPQLHHHPSYAQHVYSRIMAMPTGKLHQYGPNFAPVMMPVNGSHFVPLSSHPQPQPLPQQAAPLQQKEADKDKQPILERPKKPQSPQASQLKAIATRSVTATSPVKPPASLIQPTYRKPSPNLIVDVAETCQEKFPFEEVAKRHNVPVDKVFDVFAAIIQVPLLRCPTDRRRPGKLATMRIKEYNKAKDDILDSRADKPEGGRPGAMVNSTEIAQKLGHVGFPEGFTLRERP
ncbi:hypothetical protein NUW58_g7794 [Xylaria curta]|uniref:Uncharacterized protein n=1 Tax=Xylaria curta TaxID=42375 RepID=A0ACC1NFC1_9PEZI|nr:hypothetical protein NUW58_g7794 [Xylaria curta]